MYNILLVEDEESVAKVIKAYLEKDNYRVYYTGYGKEALNIFKNNQIDLVILDLMLPDIDGESLCKVFYEQSEVYIFMLTAKSDLNSRIEGLNIGADEYLVKPFSPRELVARVNALFRRIKKEECHKVIYNDGILFVDDERRLVKVNNKEVTLTPNEFDILTLLIKNKGLVLSRNQIINKLFGIEFDGYDRTIDVHIKNIRKKIEIDSKNPKYIITVIKVGYKFGGDEN